MPDGIKLKPWQDKVIRHLRFLCSESGKQFFPDVDSRVGVDLAAAEQSITVRVFLPIGAVVRVFGLPDGGRGWVEARVVHHMFSRVPGRGGDYVQVWCREQGLVGYHIVRVEQVRLYSAVEVLVERHRREVADVSG